MNLLSMIDNFKIIEKMNFKYKINFKIIKVKIKKY